MRTSGIYETLPLYMTRHPTFAFVLITGPLAVAKTQLQLMSAASGWRLSRRSPQAMAHKWCWKMPRVAASGYALIFRIRRQRWYELRWLISLIAAFSKI